MATKQELEAELAKTKAAPGLSDEEKKAAIEELKKAALGDAEKKLAAALAEKEKLVKELGATKEALAKAQAEAKKPAAKLSVSAGHVHLDGQEVKVTWRGGLRDLLEEYKKRNVDEEQLAVLVDKKA